MAIRANETIDALLQRRSVVVGLGLSLLGFSFLAGALFAVVVLERDRIAARLWPEVVSQPTRTDTVTNEWSTIETALLTVQRTDIELGNVDGPVTGGAIEAVGDTIIYASASGYLATLNTSTGKLVYSDVRVPMDVDRFRREYFEGKLLFNQNWFRVHDVLVDMTGRQSADLYISHHEFDPTTEEICNVISRREITVSSEGLSFGDGDWTQVFKLKKCVSPAEDDWEFQGLLSGGRMVKSDGQTLLVTVGDFGYADFLRRPEVITDTSEHHFSKILKLDLASGDVSVFANGFRNPQGLVIDNAGRIWETEHGPKGGDEVNLIIEGQHYGWPHVSLGTDYGAPRKPFPYSDRQGSHEGYTEPAYAFIPTVGPSNLIAMPAGGAFDLWAGDLVMAALTSQSLYRLRPEDDRIVYAEPIQLNVRARDIVMMDNGWIAVLSTAHSLILLRDPLADQSADRANFVVSGYDAIAPLENQAQLFASEYSWGRDLYLGYCASCHRIDGKVDVAPPLNGVLGRKIGGFDQYAYSSALKDADGDWSWAGLEAFIADPQNEFPGSTMYGLGLDDYQRVVIVNYLAGLD